MKIQVSALALIAALSLAACDDDGPRNRLALNDSGAQDPGVDTPDDGMEMPGDDDQNIDDDQNDDDDNDDNDDNDGDDDTDGGDDLPQSRTSLDASDVGEQLSNDYYQSGQAQIRTTAEAVASINEMRGSAKNVILFIGDGMGISTITSARIHEGQLRGDDGEDNVLSFGAFPFAGFSKTYNIDAQVPDSAGTMTAMMTGVKTDVGVIGYNANVERGDCSSVDDDDLLVTALELAKIGGKSTGVVSTARITHATPAATYAHAVDRNFEDDGDQSNLRNQGPIVNTCQGTPDIAAQLVAFELLLETRYNVDVGPMDVAFGGGRRSFLPAGAENNVERSSGDEGDRRDGRNLIAEFKDTYPNAVITYGTQDFDADDTGSTPDGVDFNSIDPDSVNGPVLGLFNESHMQYEADRENDALGEPSISEMTDKAIDILAKNDDGFFLMVESGRIDHAHHAGGASIALTDTIAFAEAIETAASKVDLSETLIIVTADHGHVITMGGYAKRGNPILGKVVQVGQDDAHLAEDGFPYTTLTYTNGRGFADYGDVTDADVRYGEPAVSGRVDLTNVDTTVPGFHQEALVPLGAETHSGEDVGIYGTGPGAFLLSGTNEQSMIYHVMNFAANFEAAGN